MKGFFSSSGDCCKVLKCNVTTSVCDADTDNGPVSRNEGSKSVKTDPSLHGVHSLEGHTYTEERDMGGRAAAPVGTVEPTWLSFKG